MSGINDGGPAFPVPMIPCDGDGGYTEVRNTGLTLRDWFAGQADMTPYCPFESWMRKHNNIPPTMAELADYIAEIRYIEADAMLKAREKR